ncbi:peptidoglycan-binding protein [Mangrovicoccus algicola]|uniref:Peptidoglycan-binding protein n=1 Tax=Mangrovicoccus algicola TaxID=2771008 RepID=A0A8J6YVQ1_9RHOB|nr:peptidoglycan-binding protein [Mangrovicoccus algicola]MBE3640098.1 peptidoglycan-binding protein [Mangrovicoccus algicola]
MIPVDGDFILEVAPVFSGRLAQRQREIIGEISGDFEAVLRRHDIDTALRIAHFMGQVTHECAGFRTTEEFASGAAYEGRADLGNTERGDGRRYKGRGLIQLTGRANYRRIGERLGLPLEDSPHLAAAPLTSLHIACDYWKSRAINRHCDADDLIAVTKAVNGGTNGLQDRAGYLRKARAALARRMGVMVAARQAGPDPVLRRGSFGRAVEEMQRLLAAHGAALTIDADFGPGTETALRAFQAAAGLEADGIAGQKTWTALRG